MNLPLFKKNDFSLCDVRVPASYPQSQTHAGIAYFDGKFYLTCSPYPVKSYSKHSYFLLALLRKVTNGKFGKMIDAESYENPLLYIGDIDKGRPPIYFEPAEPFPLMDTPESFYGLHAYNSDPDIFIEDGKVYILNRTYYRKPSSDGAIGKEVLISLINSFVDESGFHFQQIEDFKKTQKSLISPCLIKYNGEYLFTQLETNSAIDGHTFEGLYMQKAASMAELKGNEEYVKIEVQSNGLLPWHMSLFNYEDRLFSIITCVENGNKSHLWQMLGEFSSDLTRLKIHPRPLTDYNSYRGAAVVVDTEFVLYSTTLYDKVKGSKSVDGRDIIMARMPFEKLLEQMKM